VKPAVSIVIPALNEEGAIREIVEEIRKILSSAGRAHEIIVVDDGSSDRTGEIARHAGADVVRHPHNVGYGRSLKDGIAAARHDVVVIIDADGTYPAAEIVNLLSKFDEGFDMVVGRRTGPAYSGSFLKAPLREFLRLLVEFTSSRKIPDINSGFRVFRRNHAILFEPRLCDTFSYTTSLTLAFMMNGCFVGYQPVAYLPRVGKSKVRLVKDSLKTLQYISEAAVYYNPLRIFGGMAGLLGVVALVLLMCNIALRSEGVFLLAVGILTSTTLIFGMGLLAVALKQVHHHHLTGLREDLTSAIAESVSAAGAIAREHETAPLLSADPTEPAATTPGSNLRPAERRLVR